MNKDWFRVKTDGKVTHLISGGFPAITGSNQQVYCLKCAKVVHPPVYEHECKLWKEPK